MIRTISPTNGSVVVERKTHTSNEISGILKSSRQAYLSHKNDSLSSRVAIAEKFLALLEQNKQTLVLHTINSVE
jgi:acyl-CoA reductase-like NAD-dependent aldehyde dehydrogenase